VTLADEQRAAVVQVRLGNARQALDDAACLLERTSLRAAMNRCYYAVFYAASALLVSQGKTFRKHSGLIACFHAEYIKTAVFEREFGRILQSAFDNRSAADYQDVLRFSCEDAKASLLEAPRFVQEITAYLTKDRKADT